MDAVLEQQWRMANPPFDGITLSSRDDTELSVMRTSLISIVNLLHIKFSASQLFRLSDWHEHDGYVTSSQPSSWEDLFSLLFSRETLYAAREEDSYVRTSFYPENHAFYLRIFVSDEYVNSSHEHTGNWDLTISQAIASEFIQELHSYDAIDAQSWQAEKFFKDRYRG
jgi:hypothetical protein